MASTIKIKRGLKVNLPILEIGELGYCTDTNELFIGTSVGNELINEDASNVAGANDWLNVDNQDALRIDKFKLAIIDGKLAYEIEEGE